MATLGEERYFRNLLLFGEGGMFLLRNLVVKEEGKTGKTLEKLLLEKRTTSLSPSVILREQHNFLYPSQSTANVDLSTWDMSLLLLVINKLFSQSLPPYVSSTVYALKGYRDSFQGHPDSMSLDSSQYESDQLHIIGILRSLARYVNQSGAVEEYIRKAELDDIGIGSIIRQINETKAFSTAIQEKLEQTDQKISSLQTDMTTVKESVAVIEKDQKKGNMEMKDSLTSLQKSLDDSKLVTASIKDKVDSSTKDQEEAHQQLKESMQSLHASSEESKLGLATVLDKVDSSTKNQGDVHQELKERMQSLHVSSEESKLGLATILGTTERIERTITRLQSISLQNTRHEFTKDLDTIISAECDDDVKKAKTIDLLFVLVKILQDPHVFDDSVIRQVISQRVDWYGELTFQLIDDMFKWFGDIIQHCDGIGSPRFGSIHLPIVCSTVTCLLTVLGYINGKQCKQHLSCISSTVSKIFDTSCTLVWNVDPKSIQSAVSSHMDNIGTDESKTSLKKILLPIHATDMKGLTNAWKMFGEEECNRHLEKISGTLSKMFGETIHLKTSVDKDQLLEAVKEIDRPHRERPPGSSPKKSFDTPIVEDEEWERLYAGDHKRQPGSALEETYNAPLGSELIIERKKVQKLSFVPYCPFGILRMVATQDSRLLVADIWEPVIYELDRSFNVTKTMDLPDRLSDMCYIGEDEADVAVVFYGLRLIGLVRKSGHMTEIRTNIESCISITYHDNKLYLLDDRGVLYTYDTKEKNTSKVIVIKEDNFTYIPLSKIAVSTNGEMIYICNGEGLFTVYQGKVKTKLYVKKDCMRDICVMDNGTILVCCNRSLYQFDQYGKNLLSTTPIQIEELAYAICYDKVKSELLIADERGHIHVYDIRTKR